MDENLRKLGNKQFELKNYNDAHKFYTMAINSIEGSASLIESNETLQKCFNNRSQCNLKLKNFKEALQDANTGSFL